MKDASYNFKHFQAFKLKFKHFSDFDNNITKILAFSRISGTHTNPALYKGEKSKKRKSVAVHILFHSFIIYLPTTINRGVSGNGTVICTMAGVADTLQKGTETK